MGISFWGELVSLSKDLRKEFPEMGGFSRANMFNIKMFYLFYSHFIDDNIKVQQVVGQLQVLDNNTDIIIPQLVAQSGNNKFSKDTYDKKKRYHKCKRDRNSSF